MSISKEEDKAIACRNAIDRLVAALGHFAPNCPRTPAEIRAEVASLVEIQDILRRFAKQRFTALSRRSGATPRILAYLSLCVKEIVDSRELSVISGIQEHARRIRELRVQFGYKISTQSSTDELKAGQYRLETLKPDEDAAAKWKTMNEIRRMRKPSGKKVSGMDKALALLKAYVNKPILGEQIKYVAQIRSAERRVRQLRTEGGWRIVTKRTGRPDLANDVYILESSDPLPEHDRHIPPGTYDEVLERDDFSCRYCGWSNKKLNPALHKQFLEVHHVVFHHKGGGNDASNLLTLCNVHHDDVHRKKLSGEELLDWLSSGPASRRK